LYNESEIADICMYLNEFNAEADVGNHWMRTVWSNSSAMLGDPCSNKTMGGQYGFGAFAVLPNSYTEPYRVVNPAATGSNASVKIAPGASVAVSVNLFSFGPLDQPMKIDAVQTNLATDKSNALAFSFDKTTGVNGDRINLTITAPALAFATASPYATFAIRAQATDNLGKTRGRLLPGMVTN
jgi:hypothetical protein